ncbi:MAG: hypothetical protein IT324_17880 [Anaerolineae bacterium]|nr:hypothetical protein [Anaerolineae bacterium]
MRRLFTVAILLVSIVLSALPAHALQSITIQNPLAYIGHDGNVYVMDVRSGMSVAVTRDATKPNLQDEGDPEVYRRYRNIRWSPAGSAFIVGVEADNGKGSRIKGLYLLASGQQPRLLTGQAQVVDYPGGPRGAWSPDGKQVAYLVEPARDLTILSIPDNTQQIVGTFPTNYCTGEGSYPGVRRLLLAYERGDESFSQPHFSLDWTPLGFVSVNRGESRACTGIALTSLKGQIIWQNDFLMNVTIAPDQSRALAIEQHDADPSSTRMVIVDLATGKLTPVPFVPVTRGAYAWAVNGQSLLYSSADCRGSYREDECKVSLWRVSLADQKATKLFTRLGYDVGVITPSPDNKGVAVSLITSTPIGATTTSPAVAAGTPHFEILYVDYRSSEVTRLALGGQPAFGTGPFVVPKQ